MSAESPESPDPTPSDPGAAAAPSGGPKRPAWLIPALAGAAIAILALVAVVVVLFVAGGDDAPAAGSAGPSVEYVAAVRGPVGRLNASAAVTGRVLTHAHRAGDLARIARSSDQQLAVIQVARRRLADIPTGPAEAEAHGALSRAAQEHRAFLTALARLGDLSAADARTQVPQIRTHIRKALGQYSAFFAGVPGAPRSLMSAGLADLSGLTQAIADKKRAEDAAAASTRENSSGRSTGSSGGGSTSGALSISRASGADLGSLIEVSADYCDRTPGRVNDFLYTFQILSDGVTVASNSYSASQTRACNAIAMNFADRFALGAYTVVVRVDNLTNHVSATRYGALAVTD